MTAMLVSLLCTLGSLALSLKIPKNILAFPDVDAVEQEIVAGDRRSANFALLSAAERGGKPHLALVWAHLVMLGYDPEILLQWLSTPGKSPTAPEIRPDRVTSEARQVLFGNFEHLLDNIQSNHAESVKGFIVALAKEGGPHRVSSCLKALQVLGYSPQELQSWIQQKRLASPVAAGISTVVENSWDVHLLVHALSQADKSGVKRVLAQIVQRGRAGDMTKVLGRFAALGYDYNVLLQWLQSADTVDSALTLGPMPAGLPGRLQDPKIQDEDFPVLLKDLKAGDHAGVKAVFARMLKKGHLPSAFASLQTLGYDLDALKQWYQSGDEKLLGELRKPPQMHTQNQRSPTVTSRAPDPHGHLGTKSSEVKLHRLNDTDALFRNDSVVLTRALVNADMDTAKRALRDMLQGGQRGKTKVAETMTHLRSLGFEVSDIESWLSNESGVKQSSETSMQEPHPTFKKVVAHQNENATAALSAVSADHESEDKVKGLPGMVNASSSQTRLEEQDATPATPTGVRVIEKPSAPAVVDSVDIQEGFEQILRDVRKANKNGVVNQLASKFKRGHDGQDGQRRVAEVFAKLEAVGYDVGQVQAWLLGKRNAPTKHAKSSESL